MTRSPFPGSKPPALARWVLSRRVGGDLGEAIRGDLEETFHRDVDERGLLAARVRYWREALSPSLSRAERDSDLLEPPRRAPVLTSRRESMVRATLRDVAYAARVLRKAPGFTTVAILSLALGIGPNTAVFSLVDAVLFQEPQGDDPRRLVDVYEGTDQGRWFYTRFENVERLREGAADVFEGVAAWVFGQASVEEDGSPRPVTYELVTGNYFDVLGIRPALGRFFLPEEDATPGTHAVVVVSHAYWMDRFGGDPQALGSTLRINGLPYAVIGVSPEVFTGKAIPGVRTDLWLPYAMYPHLDPDQPGNGNLGITARTRVGVPVDRARAAVDALSARIDADLKGRGSASDFVLRAFPWTEIHVAPGFDRPVILIATLLQVVVGLVLLVACVNVASFFLTRATGRRREMAVRLAMGASRAAIVRQLLAEALLLAAAAGPLGLVSGLWTARALVGLDLPLPVSLALDIGLEPRVLAFTGGTSVLAAVLFGLAPALQASRASVASVLGEETRGVVGRAGGLRVRTAMVAGQMALSVVLLVTAGLLVRSLQVATSMDPGFDTGPAAVVEVAAGASGYEEDDDALPLVTAALTEMEGDPAVQMAAIVTRMPLTVGTHVRFFDVPGVPPPRGRNDHRLEYAAVSEDYFGLMQIRILEGRAFDALDGKDTPAVAVVSRELARRFWPDGSAVGHALLPRGGNGDPVTIVGVAEDVKIWSLAEPPRPYLYLPFSQAPLTYFDVVARGPGAPSELGLAVRDHLQQVDPGLLVPRIRSMQEHLAYILFLPRLGAVLIGGFSLLALALAAMGLWGVVSYGVASRTKEFGIRMSLGAASGQVTGLVMRNGLVLTAVGAGGGVLLALLGSRLLQRYLIGVVPWDPPTFVGVPLLLAGVAAFAAFIPARRASRIDPAEALREE